MQKLVVWLFVWGLCTTPLAAQRTFRAIIVGPSYPGGPAFDDTIASTRATAMDTSLRRWDNWDAANITRITGNTNCAAVTNALTNARNASDADDFLLFIYHGHGHFTPPADEMVPPAVNNCDETLELQTPFGASSCLDDQITAILNQFPATTVKLIVLACCRSGGFWNGQDAGDRERVPNLGLLAGCGEGQNLPEPSQFVNNLLARLDPAGWPGDNSVTIQEFVDAVMNGAAGSGFFSHWQSSCPECEETCHEEGQPMSMTWAPQYNQTAALNNTTLFQRVPVGVPLFPRWGFYALALGLGALAWIGLNLFNRKQRRPPHPTGHAGT